MSDDVEFQGAASSTPPAGTVVATEVPPIVLALTEDERELLEALDGQLQATFGAVIAPIQQKMAARMRKIETRLGLPEGAIGRSHHVAGDEVREGPMPMQRMPGAG